MCLSKHQHQKILQTIDSKNTHLPDTFTHYFKTFEQNVQFTTNRVKPKPAHSKYFKNKCSILKNFAHVQLVYIIHFSQL